MFTKELASSSASGSRVTEPFFKSIPLQRKEDSKSCESWERDLESLAIKAINLYFRSHLKQPGVMVSKIDNCQLIPQSNTHICDFTLSNKRRGNVVIVTDENRIKVQLAKEPYGTGTESWCFYNYTCNDNNAIEFTEDNCSEKE